MSSERKIAHLVSADHRIQYTNPSCGPEWTADIRKFEDYLVSEATRLNVDSLLKSSVRNSFVATVPLGVLFATPQVAHRNREGEEVDESAFKALVRQAVALNSSGKSKPSKQAKSIR